MCIDSLCSTRNFFLSLVLRHFLASFLCPATLFSIYHSTLTVVFSPLFSHNMTFSTTHCSSSQMTYIIPCGTQFCITFLFPSNPSQVSLQSIFFYLHVIGSPGLFIKLYFIPFPSLFFPCFSYLCRISLLIFPPTYYPRPILSQSSQNTRIPYRTQAYGTLTLIFTPTSQCSREGGLSIQRCSLSMRVDPHSSSLAIILWGRMLPFPYSDIFHKLG